MPLPPFCTEEGADNSPDVDAVAEFGPVAEPELLDDGGGDEFGPLFWLDGWLFAVEVLDRELDRESIGNVKAPLCDVAGAGPEDPALAPAVDVPAIEPTADDGFERPFLGYAKFEIE